MGSNKKKSYNKKSTALTGTLQGTGKGYAFVLPDDDFGHDFFVPKKYKNGAFHGDKVLAEKIAGTRDEVKIIKIM